MITVSDPPHDHLQAGWVTLGRAPEQLSVGIFSHGARSFQCEDDLDA